MSFADMNGPAFSGSGKYEHKATVAEARVSSPLASSNPTYGTDAIPSHQEMSSDKWWEMVTSNCDRHSRTLQQTLTNLRILKDKYIKEVFEKKLDVSSTDYESKKRQYNRLFDNALKQLNTLVMKADDFVSSHLRTISATQRTGLTRLKENLADWKGEKSTARKKILIELDRSPEDILRDRGIMARSDGNLDDRYGRDDDEFDKEGEGELEVQQQEVDGIVDLVDERAEGVQNVQHKIAAVHAAMRSLGQIVDDQGHDIDLIVDTVTTAAVDIEIGVDDLRDAEKKSRKSTKKFWFVLIGIVIVLALIALFFILKN
ncbi:hypothetical protein ADUPG1_013066 [Aduncisulcus paluster]|uniref:t-SNARE coiled-coil homology domain-containing protein n=1 Tax=Aduncisulcus paluster TaxID=2918883 RepID=A0ABQ5K6E2_9EUKA|nr:hypothetical protein ADUPG1_013066 [Aduncisulcus paluster]|eukprot:gnl/Carplike_NY0171/4022_a5444_423.p1 GENE.gnl/Carplike_NY0171/4022_a5444_423~~gnl/Carplike_NY0171/4022_a5444_423.p1  ORF type:complete len:316 (-),score=89.55 gnl/Carplike_NY0171/4022_a5444_423:499-1446(-)